MDNAENKCSQCPVRYTLSIVGGKWKWLILWQLAQGQVIRYGRLKESLPSIAHKTLSQQLKELENHGLIHREQYNEVPPRVEYSLTIKGETLLPVFEHMAQWGKQYMPAD